MASYATYKDLPIEKRTADATKIRTKYPDMIPVLLDHNLELKKFKYLVPNYFSFAELMATVRMQMSIMPPDVGLFLFVNNEMPPMTSRLCDLSKSCPRNSTAAIHLFYKTMGCVGGLLLCTGKLSDSSSSSACSTSHFLLAIQNLLYDLFVWGCVGCLSFCAGKTLG